MIEVRDEDLHECPHCGLTVLIATKLEGGTELLLEPDPTRQGSWLLYREPGGLVATLTRPRVSDPDAFLPHYLPELCAGFKVPDPEEVTDGAVGVDDRGPRDGAMDPGLRGDGGGGQGADGDDRREVSSAHAADR